LEKETASEKEKLGPQIASLEERLTAVSAEKDRTVEELKAARAGLKSAEEKYSKETSGLLKRLEAAEAMTSKVGRELAEEEEKEQSLREDIREREAELERRVEELQGEAAGSAQLIKDLEKRLATQKDASHATEKKAASLADELEKVRGELLRLRQQHEALQGMIKRQDKTAGERPMAEQPGVTLAPFAQESRLSVFLKMAALALVVVVCAAVAFRIGTNRGRSAGVQAGLEMAQVMVKPAENQVVQPPKGIVWPKIAVKGVKITTGEKECAMVFEYSVFSSRANIASEAAEALVAVASQIRGRMSEFSLIIEGHTDTTPVSSGSTGNNYKLGLARANAVLDFLESKCAMPADSMTATSKGEEDPPYPNTDEASRRKNRTVILKLTPKGAK
jgi:flagellar motor protein MotB